uniref:protein-histidine N-methyltransferase n=1 Tax=Trichuris muris TaxID=70415 RepID=A0A5S6QIS7_TRIMR
MGSTRTILELVHQRTSQLALELGSEIDQLQLNFPRAYRQSRWLHMQKYSSWCESVGIKSDRLQPKLVEGHGIGLFAKEDISTGEVLITVPRKAYLTVQRHGELAKVLKAHPILNLVNTCALALALLYEAFRKDSFWADYISILPAYEDSPFSFSEEELTAIKHTSCFSKVDSMVRNICRHYAYIYNLFFTERPDFGESEITPVTFTFENFRWAMFMATSRGNSLPSTENKSNRNPNSLAFIPHWDLLNHDSSVPRCSEYDAENKAVRFAAGKSWHKDEQVFTSYGNRTNEDFLVHYGFVPANGDNYATVIHLGFAANDSSYKLRSEIMQKHNFNANENFCLMKNRVVAIDNSILRFSLIFVANKEQLSMLKATDDPVPVDEPWRNKAVEFLSKRLTLMAKACSAGISKAPRQVVRPSIQMFVDMEVKLYEECADFVKTPEMWPPTLTPP